MVGTAQERLCPPYRLSSRQGLSASLRVQSTPATPKKEWIASSLSLLAMAENTASRSRRGFARGLILNFPPSEDQRAQGMPGDDLTHGPPPTKKAGGSPHRFSRINRHSPRNGLRLISRSPRGPGSFAPVAHGSLHDLDAS